MAVKEHEGGLVVVLLSNTKVSKITNFRVHAAPSDRHSCLRFRCGNSESVDAPYPGCSEACRVDAVIEREKHLLFQESAMKCIF